MPTMVMAHPPKTSGNTMRKRQKGKNDRIVPISYMFVGAPKRKFLFYVRERMVYRSNVEVTYDEVFNFLVNTHADNTISLHYTVNGQYVPITTTGQLHTFIRTVHTDPQAFLYIENHDYVWNVTPQTKGHKMEKRNPNGGAATPPQGGEDDEELDSQEDTQGDGATDEEEEVDDEDDLEYEDEEEGTEDDESQDERSDGRAARDTTRVVFPDRAMMKDTFAEPQAPEKKAETALPTSGPSENPTSDEKSAEEGAHVSEPGDHSARTLYRSAEAYEHLKGIITGSLKHSKPGPAARQVAEQLVSDVWGPNNPHSEKVFRQTVELLEAGIGAGLLQYYERVIKKQESEPAITKEKTPLDSILSGAISPLYVPEFLVEFIESATIAACDMLECVQHLNKLDEQFDYFLSLLANLTEENTENNGTFTMPETQEVVDRLIATVTAAQWGFKVLDLVFPEGCDCRDPIRTLIMELEKMTSIMNNMEQKTTSPETIHETKLFVIETLEAIIGRFRNNKCQMHGNVTKAIQDAESFKWHNDAQDGFQKWDELRARGENRFNVPQSVNKTQLAMPAPFAVKPDAMSSDPSVMPVADLQECFPANPLSAPITTAPDAAAKKNQGKPPKAGDAGKASDQSTSGGTTTTTTGSTSGGGSAVVSKTMSAELRRLVDAMYKSIPPQHNHVYPTPPKAGSILIPTGGLARCRCSKNCQELLMEPAYEYIDRFNEPRQTVWEKTKQKRFKKN